MRRLSPILLFLLAGCASQGARDDAFNRKALLRHYADSLIIPGLASFTTALDSLEQTSARLTSQPDVPNLRAARMAWQQVAVQWQYVNAFNFGPGAEAGLSRSFAEELGTWPVRESRVLERIRLSQTAFADFERDTRGLYTLEFLLFPPGQSDAAAAALFQDAARRTYFNAVLQHAVTRATALLEDWRGPYRTAFIENDGTDAGSSISMLYNEFVKSYEGLKNFKVGIPLGLRAGQTRTEPALVEAYYSGLSLLLLEHHLRALEAVWRGGTGTHPHSFRAYLGEITGGTALIGSTEQQLALLFSTLASLDRNVRFSDGILSNPAPYEPLFVELQRHTRFFKSEMSSLLGISITYASGDGD